MGKQISGGARQRPMRGESMVIIGGIQGCHAEVKGTFEKVTGGTRPV